jgi:sugar/nucleoside kinase (ribokinase family)
MSLAIVGYASLDYTTSTPVFRGIDATSILQRGIVSTQPGIGGIAHIVLAAAQTGVATEAVSWVGSDAQGGIWAQALEAAGCGTSGVAQSGSRSPSATMIEVGTGGTICLFDPADCHPEQLTDAQRAVVANSSSLALTVSPRHLSEQILDVLPDDATLLWAVKHDANAYSSELLRRVLGRADVVSFSSGERSYVSLDGIAPELLVKPGTLVVETMGSRGVAWSFGSVDGPVRAGSIPVDPVEADDTTGAGDTFIGTLAGLAAQSGPLFERSDDDVAAIITSASSAAAELLRSRSRSTSGPMADVSQKETL